MDDETPLTKQQVLEADECEFAALMQMLDGLSDEQLTAPTMEGGWSVKDNLAHLAAWQKNVIRRIEQNGKSVWDMGKSMDEINEDFYQQDKDRPLADVLTDFHATRHTLRTMVLTMPEQAVSQPSYFDWWQDEPLSTLLVGDMDEHYREHIDYLRPYIERVRQGEV